MSRQDAAIAQILKRVGKSSRKPLPRATGRVRSEHGKMNGLETAYSMHLEADKTVAWYKFDAIKLRLADDTFYVPDFLVLLVSGELQVHEVKGHWEDDARVKVKVAAAMYPFAFLGLTRDKATKEWVVEQF